MKRSIPRSLVSKATSPDTSKERTPGPEGRAETGDAVSTPFKGAGSAWKSGALAQSQAAVERSRAELCSDILNGRHEISLSPDQISDPMGTDRRQDWMSQEAFRSLVNSIASNGQDTPILVWPEDPAMDWGTRLYYTT